MSSEPTIIIATVRVPSLPLRVVPPVNVALGITTTTFASLDALASIITTSAEGSYPCDDGNAIIEKAATITKAITTSATRRV